MAIQTCNSLDNMLRSILMIVMAEKEQEQVGSQSPSSIVIVLAGCVHGIFQARILQRVAISSSRGSSRPSDGTHVCCPDPGRELTCLLHLLYCQTDSLPLVPPGKPMLITQKFTNKLQDAKNSLNQNFLKSYVTELNLKSKPRFRTSWQVQCIIDKLKKSLSLSEKLIEKNFCT